MHPLLSVLMGRSGGVCSYVRAELTRSTKRVVKLTYPVQGKESSQQVEGASFLRVDIGVFLIEFRESYATSGRQINSVSMREAFNFESWLALGGS